MDPERLSGFHSSSKKSRIGNLGFIVDIPGIAGWSWMSFVALVMLTAASSGGCRSRTSFFAPFAFLLDNCFPILLMMRSARLTHRVCVCVCVCAWAAPRECGQELSHSPSFWQSFLVCFVYIPCLSFFLEAFCLSLLRTTTLFPHARVVRHCLYITEPLQDHLCLYSVSP